MRGNPEQDIEKGRLTVPLGHWGFRLNWAATMIPGARLLFLVLLER